MGAGEMTKEIADLNLTYMLLAQKLLRADKAAAMLRLGIRSEVADMLVSMSLADTLRLAASNFVLCAFRLDELPVVQDVMQGGRQASLQHAHLSILLAGAQPAG
jgi:flagellar transcriptional activator FlhD